MDSLNGIFADEEALEVFWTANGVHAHKNIFEFKEVYGKFAQKSMPGFLSNSDEAKYELKWKQVIEMKHKRISRIRGIMKTK